MSALRPGDVPASLADRPYDAALHLMRKIEELKKYPHERVIDEEIARLTQAMQELTAKVKAEERPG